MSDRQRLFKALLHSPPEPCSREAHQQRRLVLNNLTGVTATERITEENIGNLAIAAPIGVVGSDSIKPANLDELIGREPHSRGWGGGVRSFWRGVFHRPWYGRPLLYAPPPILPMPVPLPPPVMPLPYGLPPEAVLYDPAYDLPVGWMLLSNGYRVPLGADLTRLGGGVRVLRRQDRSHSRPPPPHQHPQKQHHGGGGGDGSHKSNNKPIKEPLMDDTERIESALASQNINEYPKYASQLEAKQRMEMDMNATRAEFKRLGKLYAERQRQAQTGSV